MNLFMAGGEEVKHRASILIGNNPNVLVSYYYLTGGKHKMNADFLHDYPLLKGKVKFIMDSGLFTMMFGSGKGKTYTSKDLHDYTDRYLANVKKMGYEDYIVEMDVHKLLGMTELQDFRNKFATHHPIEKVIFVWHIEEGIDGFKEMCKKYPYVALSIPELRIVMQQKYLKNFIQKMIGIAAQINPEIKIHLLGCTSNYLLEQGGYYSADSTSWQAALRYGSFKVPHNKYPLTADQMVTLADSKEPEILHNNKLLAERYGIKIENTTRAKQTYYNKSAVSVAFFRFMAECVNRDFYNREYPVFDPDFKPLIGRNKIV